MASDAAELIAIGAFALMTELSIPRLRRYHDMGLLVPDHVDELTGYRSYSTEQVERGRAIARLRRADLPLEELEPVLDHLDDPLALLRRHRERLESRIATTRRMVDIVDQLITEEKKRMSTTSLQLMEVILRVEDVDATVAFYRDVLGMEFQADDHKGALPLHYDACGGSWDPEGFFLFTIYPAGDNPPTRANVGFGVPDVDEVWARARARGANEISPPKDSGYMPIQAVFEDNAGNRVNVYQRAGAW